MCLKHLNKNLSIVIEIIDQKIMFLKFYLKDIFYKYFHIYYINNILKLYNIYIYFIISSINIK